jgi:hypothetical protein
MCFIACILPHELPRAGTACGALVAGASAWPGRGFGARGDGERLQRDAFVTHLENLEWLCTARRVHDDTVAGPVFHQRARQRRLPADMTAIQIDLIDANDAYFAFGAGAVSVAHRRSEEDLTGGAARSRNFRIHDFRGIDSFRKKADAPINLTQPPFVELIVGVLAAIAIASGPGHHLCDRRPFSGKEEPQLISQSLETARSDVVLDADVRVVPERHAEADRNPGKPHARNIPELETR